jgi:hypothetical protein
MSYQKEHKKWKAREPKNANSYEYERWLEERPEPKHHANGEPRKPRKKK